MGRSPCCEKVGLKKGPWTPEEDQKLLAYIEEHGHGSWRALPTKAGLQRCGKSCRLRWTNYLRPDIKRGKFSLQEEQTIIQLHALLGNRWSAIATHLPKRTDNEIKNYWNTHLKKRLTKMGIDPVTHKPKNDALVSSSSSSSDGIVQSKNAANLSHMAQWESARLEAEARLVRESRLRSIPFQCPSFDQSPAAAATSPPLVPPAPRSLDVLNAWQGMWSKSSTTTGNGGGDGIPVTGLGGDDLESPTSTLTFFENNAALISLSVGGNNKNENENENSMAHHVIHDFVGIKEEGGHQEQDQEWKLGFENSIRLPELSFLSSTIHDMTILQMDQDHAWSNGHVNSNINDGLGNEGFTDLLLSNSSKRNGRVDADSDDSGDGGGECDENKIYWNTILNLVNSSPPDTRMF